MGDPCKPCLKWAGGKTQILEQVTSKFPNTIHNYYEPFVGGGAVAIRVMQQIREGHITLTGGVYLGDYNADLIHLYQYLKTDPSALLEKLRYFCDYFSSSHTQEREKRHRYQVSHGDAIEDVAMKGRDYLYYYFREVYNHSETDPLTRAALLLVLNKTCFRGLYRIGPNGFNVPYGNYSNPTIYQGDHLEYLHQLFQSCDANFIHTDFGQIRGERESQPGDFWYLDPPYYPLKPTSFTSYGNGFGDTDHLRLAEFCHNLNKEGGHFVQSNSKCTTNLHRYSRYQIQELPCRRRINSQNPKDSDWELIINNF